MGILGKHVKGRGQTTNEDKRYTIKVKNQSAAFGDVENEMKRIKMQRQHLKQQMQDEQKMAHFNRMKILTYWRKVLRLAKTEQLKKDIQIYQQNHDREIDAKEAMVQMYDRDLDEAEEQYQMALRNHLIHIDDLIALQQSRLKGLHVEFERDVMIIKDEYDRERKDIERTHELETEELREMIQTITDEEHSKLQQMSQDFEALREETKNRNVEELEGMKFILIGKIEELDKEFQVHYNQFSSETKQVAKSYEQKLELNKNLSTEISHLNRTIDRNRHKKMYWQMKTEQNDREFTQRNKMLTQEKMNIYKHYK